MATNRHVVPNGGKGWKVTGGSRKRSYPTQADAIGAARRDIKRRGGGEMNIHGRDGRIRDKDTIPTGSDPHPPKG